MRSVRGALCEYGRDRIGRSQDRGRAGDRLGPGRWQTEA